MDILGVIDNKCKRCNGSGIIVIATGNYKEDAQTDIKTCPDCKGTGKIMRI